MGPLMLKIMQRSVHKKMIGNFFDWGDYRGLKFAVSGLRLALKNNTRITAFGYHLTWHLSALLCAQPVYVYNLVLCNLIDTRV